MLVWSPERLNHTHVRLVFDIHTSPPGFTLTPIQKSGPRRKVPFNNLRVCFRTSRGRRIHWASSQQRMIAVTLRLLKVASTVASLLQYVHLNRDRASVRYSTSLIAEASLREQTHIMDRSNTRSGNRDYLRFRCSQLHTLRSV